VDERKQTRPVDELIRPFQRFASLQVSGGIALLLGTMIALVWANSPWAGSYEALWKTPLALQCGPWHLERELHAWINEGLMTLFFFVVGLEIKRELLVGELSSPKQAALPAMAALGGMLVPAAIYLVLNWGRPTQSGWGIPVATDIAFSLGILALLGNRIPPALKVFLAAFAIIDDLGAILVIAIAYSSHIAWNALALTGLFSLALIGVNILRVRSPIVYSLLGIGLWITLLHSGIHATLAGVATAFAIPARTLIKGREFLRRGRHYLGEFEKTEREDLQILENERRLNAIQALERACEQMETPLQRLSHGIHPWVTYGIMPLFALANAGIPIRVEAFSLFKEPMGIGIVCGLVLGKPLGIFMGSWLSVRLGLAQLPQRIEWEHLLGVGFLGGIGFTMSLFIVALAFPTGSQLAEAKLAIVIASSLSGWLGLWLLRRSVSTH
jgi:NhaA family Na+:H+ antiporter